MPRTSVELHQRRSVGRWRDQGGRRGAVDPEADILSWDAVQILVPAASTADRVHARDCISGAGDSGAPLAGWPADTVRVRHHREDLSRRVRGGGLLRLSPIRDGLVGFVVADVSGHGIDPAIVMVATQAHLRSLAGVHTEVYEILKLANVRHCKQLKDDLFVTLLQATLDPETRSFVYASVGHPTGYIIGSSGEVKAHLESTGVPLGIMPEASSPISCPMTLDPGDVVLLLADGLPEARSRENSLFGTERVITSAISRAAESA